MGLKDYYCAGYFLIRAQERDDWLKTGLLPPKLVSLSTHISPRLMVYWGWQPDDLEAARDFGIPEQKLDDFLSWCRSPETSEWFPGVFETLKAAREFIAEFELDKSDLHIIGVALHQEMEASNWRENDETPSKSGIEKMVEKKYHLEPDGEILGHEIVGFSHHSFDCSWLCNGVEKEMSEQFGIKPNGHGLVTDYADAKKICDWIMVDPATRAEPIEYDVWLLVSYPLES